MNKEAGGDMNTMGNNMKFPNMPYYKNKNTYQYIYIYIYIKSCIYVMCDVVFLFFSICLIIVFFVSGTSFVAKAKKVGLAIKRRNIHLHAGDQVQ